MMKRSLRLVAVAVAMLCVVTVSGGFCTALAEEQKTGTVINVKEFANVRAEPNTKSAIVGKVGLGETVIVLDKSSGWYRIEINSDVGYLRSDFLTVEGEKQEKSEPKKKGVVYEITHRAFKVDTNSFGKVVYDALIQIKNIGTQNIYIKDVIFDIEDDNGKLIDTSDFVSSDPYIIAPGEYGYIYTNGRKTIDNAEASETYNLTPTIKVEKAKGKITRLPVSDVSLTTGLSGNPSDKGIDRRISTSAAET